MKETRFPRKELTEGVRRRMYDCYCCGYARSQCTCWSSSFIDGPTGDYVLRHCEPKDHGRKEYGWDD